jgi:molecular chaperone IbpA
MGAYDFAPLWKWTIGFDRQFDFINGRFMGRQDGYPPYDIARTGEESYRISLALAGFSPEDITITTQQNFLTVAGVHSDRPYQEFIYKGIPAQRFERRFSLADHIEVEHATFTDGLLQIDLVRKVPDAMTPRRIEITAQSRNTKPKATMKMVEA